MKNIFNGEKKAKQIVFDSDEKTISIECQNEDGAQSISQDVQSYLERQSQREKGTLDIKVEKSPSVLIILLKGNLNEIIGFLISAELISQETFLKLNMAISPASVTSPSFFSSTSHSEQKQELLDKLPPSLQKFC